MIVKVQLSEYPKDALCLIYNEDRSFLDENEPSPAIVKALRRNRKGFFEVKVNGREIEIIRRIKDLEW